MQPVKIACLALFAMAAGAVPAVWCLAAPVFPGPAKVTGAQSSLRDLRSVRIEIEHLPPVLARRGLSVNGLKAQMRRGLTAGGIASWTTRQRPCWACGCGR